jgi:hypothetical protein
MNGVAKLYENAARGALDNLDIASKIGKAFAHTYVSAVEAMGLLQSDDPNT